jgi:hypothetical protein
VFVGIVESFVWLIAVLLPVLVGYCTL